MPYNKTYVDIDKPFCGWYYDDQRDVYSSSRILAVSLHPNALAIPVTEKKEVEVEEDGKKVTKKLGEQEKLEWIYDNDERLFTQEALLHYPYGNLVRDDNASKNLGIAMEDEVHGYLIEPLCTSFTEEDFSIAVANNYQQAGGDTLEQLWNSAKPMAPALKKIQVAGETADKLITDMAEGDHGMIVSTIGGILDSGVKAISSFLGGSEKIKQGMDSLDEYLNKSLVMNGARFSYYGGTNISFNNITMKFTVFPKWKWFTDPTTGERFPRFVTVTEQMTDLLPYCVGQYEEWLQANTFFENINLTGVFGWNSPPGGFRMNGSDVDLVQRGTLKLKIGSLYCLTNLVVENAMFNFSKTMVKNPGANYYRNGKNSVYGFDNGQTDTDWKSRSTAGLTPLYCEVTLQLRPTTKYTSRLLEAFIKGDYNSFDREVVNSYYNYNLEHGRKTMEDRYFTRATEFARLEEKAMGGRNADAQIAEQKKQQEIERKREEAMKKSAERNGLSLDKIEVPDEDTSEEDLELQQMITKDKWERPYAWLPPEELDEEEEASLEELEGKLWWMEQGELNRKGEYGGH